MNLRRTRLLTETNNGHFSTATFDWTFKAGVWLDAIDRKNSIGSCSESIEINRHATWCTRYFNGFHGRTNFSADSFLCHTQRCKHFNLSFGGSPSVTSHRWNDKWLSAKFAQPFNRAAQQINTLGESSTSTSYGNSHPRTDIASQSVNDCSTGGFNDIFHRFRIGNR
ncbi:unannotated protein [freshwater metagenome]|uniref:Unannotated protein n=1 Tax=freshwater metagenome TaxID=449393 RepID=A0A6J6WTD9_9ZZZZ